MKLTPFIDGKWTGGLSRVFPHPYTLQPQSLIVPGPTGVDEAVSAAVTAFKSWKKVPWTSRRQLLVGLADAIRLHSKLLSELETMGGNTTTSKRSCRTCYQFQLSPSVG